jgi:hypothetical protein
MWSELSPEEQDKWKIIADGNPLKRPRRVVGPRIGLPPLDAAIQEEYLAEHERQYEESDDPDVKMEPPLLRVRLSDAEIQNELERLT